MSLVVIKNYPNIEKLKQKAIEVLKKRGYKIVDIDRFDDPTVPYRFYLVDSSGTPLTADVIVRWFKVTQNIAHAISVDLIIYGPSDYIVQLMSPLDLNKNSN